MTTLVTGGCGFVMANLVHRLAQDPASRTIVFDVARPDRVLSDWLADCAGRIDFVQGDVTEASSVAEVCRSARVTTVVHGATVTDHPSWERRDPARYVSINVGGTVAVLDAVRCSPSVDRVLYISSGAVYGEPMQATERGPVDEDALRAPQELYGITKDTSERLVERYGQLFGRTMTSVRLSGVFGPLERPTAFRRKHSPAYPMVLAAAERRPCLVSSRSLVAVADLLSAQDVADAVERILRLEAPRPVYNVALGRFVSIADVLEALGSVENGFRWQVEDGPSADTDVDVEPRVPRGRYDAYAIDRVRADTQWQPRPIAQQLASYLEWLTGGPGRRSRTRGARQDA